MAKIETLSTSFLASTLRGDKKATVFSFVDEFGQPVKREAVVDELIRRGDEPTLCALERGRILPMPPRVEVEVAPPRVHDLSKTPTINSQGRATAPKESV